VKLIQRRRLGLPVPDPFDIAWEFSKGEMSLEKSVFDWFNPTIQANRMPTQPLHSMFDPQAARHAAMLESIKTNATPEVKPQKLLDDSISAMPLLGTGHEEHTPDPNAHHEPNYLVMNTKPIEEVQQENAEQENAEQRDLDQDYNFGLMELLTRINERDNLKQSKVIADIPLPDNPPKKAGMNEIVMPEKTKTVTEEIKAARERTSQEQSVQDHLKVVEELGLFQNKKKPIKTFSNNKTIGDIFNQGMITENTPEDVIQFLHEIVEDDQHRLHTSAKQIYYNNQDDLVEHHGYEEDDEVFQKGIQTIVENPFANPFYDTSAFSIKKERPKGFVAPPAITPPIDLIKQEQPNAIEGFETKEGDDLSLLPSSVFKNTDAPVVDNMSLLPTGWKNE